MKASKSTVHYCDCKRKATHKASGTNDWECDECKRLNKIASEILLPYVGSSEHGQSRK